MTEQPVTDADQPPVRIERDGIVATVVIDRPKALNALSPEVLVALIELGRAAHGHVPRATWQNFPTDLFHFVSYFAAHEGHHRGQLLMIARQLGVRLPRDVANGVWQWTRLSRGR